jgi:competence CoiA-like predicted nuclease
MSIKKEPYSNESYAHMIMKQFFYKMIPKFNTIKYIKKEYQGFQEHVPDIYIILKNNKKIAIECQTSSMTLNELQKRTCFYTEKDLYTLWVFLHRPMVFNDIYRTSSYFIDINKIGKELIYNTKLLERTIYFEMYFRIYYLKLYNNKISFHSIYLIKKASRYIEMTDYGGGYNKKYKNRFIMNNFPINNLKISFMERNGYKLAKFNDPHPNNKKKM